MSHSMHRQDCQVLEGPTFSKLFSGGKNLQQIKYPTNEHSRIFTTPTTHHLRTDRLRMTNSCSDHAQITPASTHIKFKSSYLTTNHLAWPHLKSHHITSHHTTPHRHHTVTTPHHATTNTPHHHQPPPKHHCQTEQLQASAHRKLPRSGLVGGPAYILYANWFYSPETSAPGSPTNYWQNTNIVQFQMSSESFRNTIWTAPCIEVDATSKCRGS